MIIDPQILPLSKVKNRKLKSYLEKSDIYKKGVPVQKTPTKKVGCCGGTNK